jgi:hypothetical protein
MSEPRATIADVRAARLCARGLRVWLAHHGFDYLDFLERGLRVSELEATGDLFALKVAQVARARAETS